MFKPFGTIAISGFLTIALTCSVQAQDKAPVSKDYTVGKPTQKVTPREMKETVRPDGKTSIVTGQQRDANGKITGPHSHSIVNNGTVESSRTAGGRPVVGTAPPQGGGGGRDKAK